MFGFKLFLTAAFLSLMLSIGTIAVAQDGPQAPVRDVIQGQLNAFASGDRDAAYSYAAPMIQQRFGDAGTFMKMVETGYGALIDPAAVDFERFEARNDRAVQEVRIVARDGTAWRARYLMERLEDGTWRIAGCQMEQLPAGTV